MSRRRGSRPRQARVVTAPFEPAYDRLDKLELNVVRHCMTVDFDLPHLLRAIYSESLIELMQRAYAACHSDCHRSLIYEHVTCPAPATFMAEGTLVIMGDVARMLPPLNGIAVPIMDGAVQECFSSIYQQHMEFEKVREVVAWLNSHATPAAAKHFCPWLTALLPIDHAYQDASGVMFHQPEEPMAGIIPKMRQCAHIVAAAMLAPPFPEDVTHRAAFRFPDCHQMTQDFWFL